MSSSAISTQVAQLKIGNVQNQADTSAVYNGGIWSFKDATAVTRFYISNSGEVGLGTTTPEQALHVKNIQANLRLESTALTNNALVRFTNNVGTAFCGIDSSAGGLGAAYGFHIWHPGNNPIVFTTNSSECMRIRGDKSITMGNKTGPGENVSSGSGWSFVAPTDPYFTLVNGNASGGNALMYMNRRTTGALVVFMTNNGTTDSTVGNISHNGSTVTFSGSALSDARWKEDIQSISGALDAIKQVDFVEFKFKENQQHSAGVTAQQLKTVDKLAKFVNDGRDEDCYKAVDYHALFGYLGKAIQELSAKVDFQDREIRRLKGEAVEEPVAPAPVIEPAPAPAVEQPAPQPEAQSQSVLQPEEQSAPQPEPEPEIQPEPTVQSEPEVQSQSAPQPAPEPEVQPVSEPESP